MILAAYLPPIDAAVDARLIQAYGTQRWLRMRKALVHAPPYTCLRINTLQADAATALKEVEKWLEAYHTQRQDKEEERFKPYLHPMLKDTIIIPSLPSSFPSASSSSFSSPSSSSQSLIESLSSPPADKKRPYVVVVDRLCGEAVLRGADVFVRGVWAASGGQ